jgi:hypothetical protein
MMELKIAFSADCTGTGSVKAVRSTGKRMSKRRKSDQRFRLVSGQ